MKAIFLSGALALVCVQAQATTFTFTAESGYFPIFDGWFEGTDRNGDGVISGNEVSAYFGRVDTGGYGPGDWHMRVNSSSTGSEETFFNVTYNYIQRSLSYLSFGLSQTVPCADPDGLYTGNTGTYAQSVSLRNERAVVRMAGYYIPGSGYPTNSCERYGSEQQVTVSQVVSVDYDPGDLDVIPLPPSLPILLAGMSPLLILGLRRRQPARLAAKASK